jgi:hypothetical protein
VTTDTRVMVRVYRMPEHLTEGHCFGVGVPISFLNVDWFTHDPEEGRAPLEKFIRTKRYFDPGASFLVIGDHPDLCFVMEKTK